MMILIDKDKLIQSFETDSPDKERFSEIVIRNIIELQPEVKAFPVEWLINKYTYATEDILEDWERYLKEQEVNQVIDELTDTWRKYGQEVNKDGRL